MVQHPTSRALVLVGLYLGLSKQLGSPVSSTSFLPRDLHSPWPQSLMRSRTRACACASVS